MPVGEDRKGGINACEEKNYKVHLVAGCLEDVAVAEMNCFLAQHKMEEARGRRS